MHAALSSSEHSPRAIRPTPDKPGIFRPLPLTSPPFQHRDNLASMLYAQRTSRVLPYNAVRRYFGEALGVGDRLTNLAALLRQVFGVFAGSWLHANLYARQDKLSFIDRLVSFTDPHEPYVSRSPTAESSDAERADIRAFRTEFKQAERAFTEDTQRANRERLAEVLDERDGVVHPRGYTRRWCLRVGLTEDHARTRFKFKELFGYAAANALLSSDHIDRRKLARHLRSL